MSTGSSGSGSQNLQSGFADVGNLMQNTAPWYQPVPYPNTGAAANNAYSGISGGFQSGFPGGWSPAVGSGQLSGFSNQLGGLESRLSGPAADLVTQGNKLFHQGDSLMTQGQNFLGQTGMAYPAIQMGTDQYKTLTGLEAPLQQAAFDPQQALYDRTLAQVRNQTLAGEAQQGVANTPYGAGITAQANENFNIDWQNKQLQREIAGAGAIGNVSSTAMNDLATGYGTAANWANTMGTLGSNLMGQGLNYYGGAGGLYGQSANDLNSIANMIVGQAGMQNQQLGLLQFPNTINQQQIQDFLSYLGSSSGNTYNWLSSVANLMAGATGSANSMNQANYNNNALLGQSLGGLGQLGGQGLGALASYGGLSKIASALGPMALAGA